MSMTPAKMTAKYINGHAFKPSEWCDVGLPIVRIAQLQGASFDNYFSGECPERCHIDDGDLLFSWSATLDSFIWDRGPAYLNQHIFKVIPNENVSLRFMFYSLKHYAPIWADIDAHGSTMRHIKRESLSNPIWHPSYNEQIAIAAFLDHETGKIDDLIAEQEQLITLLNEKRQAVISHAVTKGIDPDIEMKDSGIEWLGEVPAHWNVSRLKDIADCFPSNIDKHSKEGEVPVRLCNYTDVYKNEEITENMTLMEATAPAHQVEKFTLRAGDVIITKDSESPDDIARPAYVPNDMNGVVCGYHLTMIRAGEHAEGRFIAKYFDTYAARAYFHVSVNGFTRVGLGQAALGSAPIAMPPIKEQELIADYLYQITQAMDKLKVDSKETVALLKERRSALISAAVTGKIDVRNHPAAVAALNQNKDN